MRRLASAAGTVASTAAVMLLLAASARAAPPAIVATSVTDVQGISALLGGRVDTGGVDTTYRFEYVDQATFDADQPDGFAHATSTPEALLLGGAGIRVVGAAVSGLAPDTAYRYRLRAQSSAGTAIGPGQAFTTFHGFGFPPGPGGFDVAVVEDGGATPATEAGSHPDAIVTTVNFNQAGESEDRPGVPVTDGDARDIHLELPPGLIENPSAVSKCSQDEFHTPRDSPFENSLSGESCQALSQIGVVEIRSSAGGGSSRTFGVFNLTPPPGFPSQIGFSPFGTPVAFTPHIRELGGEYGITLDLHNLSQRVDVYGLTLTIWGTPWAIRHNGQRGECLNEAEPAFPFAKCPVGVGARSHLPFAYLTLPASCTGPIAFSIVANSWQQSAFAGATALSRDASGAAAGLTGCAALHFEPVATAQATNPRASSPSGFDFSLTPKEEALTNPERRVPSQARTAVVTLPEGMTINPSLAAGLGACSATGYGAETATSAPGAGCPETSKIGTFTVQSPLFEETVRGAVFLAEPDDRATARPGAENPFDSLLALYLVAKLPARGVLVKVAGKLVPDPASGRLTATFDDLPQLPYSNLKIHFREGQRAPLVTPSACGTFSTGVDLAPWNDPGSVVHAAPQFQIARGIGAGEACPSGAISPFAPGAVGGTLSANAGSYSPFYLHLTRADSEQELTSYSATLPPGLTGKIAGIPYCPDAAIAASKRKTGREEERHPSCPAASEIGHTVSGYGASSVLAYAPGKLYLAGPYHGSAFSVVAIDSATVGPFDLGVVIVRSAIEVDRRTAQVSIDSAGSDPIPHILEGVPIHLRDVRVYIDRPQGTLNPTSCEPLAVSSILTGAGARFSDPADDSSATVANRFQVSNCSSLGFGPRLGFHLRGGTERGDFPSLSANVRPRTGDANIGRAAVTLPRTLFLAQDHIDEVCSRRQFAAGNCPRGSAYGEATAITPLLAAPLHGPVYLRSSDNPLPDLVVALRGNGIAIDLIGRIDSYRSGIRTTFDVVPDAPVTRFALTLKGGKRGILVNAEDVCASPQRALARFVAHDNAGAASHPLVRASCGGRKR
jgi:hypothetical protein